APGSHDQQPPAYEPAGVGAAAQENSTDYQHRNGENPRGRLHQSRDVSVVAEQGLKQAGQRSAGAVWDTEGTEDDDAGGREVAPQQRSEVDHWVGDPRLPGYQAPQTHHEQAE